MAYLVATGRFKWLEILSHHGLPGKDFVIVAPSHDLKSFKDLVANFYHCQSMLRTLLLHAGFTASEAMTFSSHSWRHLFPTAGRQLRLSNETLNDMGHWAPNSGMPQRYDSAACVSELTGKASVRRAFQGGWSMVGPGCVPLPVASQDSTCSVVKKPKIQPDKVTNVLVPVVSGYVVSKPSTIRAAMRQHYRNLVNGSSSVTQGDILIGATWSQIQRLQVFQWFDRVDSKSNPVDGLSRGRLDGPWKVESLAFPGSLFRALRLEEGLCAVVPFFPRKPGSHCF